jgi:alkanesulfonate monooxygenase SsuD/methylene tetrahydromethanopterin reductase-like flavin-dependent oxidoreductase (luciferase family)
MKFAAYAMPSYSDEFGLTQSQFLSATLDHLVAAEDLGFDSVWVNEHHFHRYGGMMPALPTMLAALSQRTSRVRLGTSVVVLPLHNPLQVAEQLAMVDLLSGGRLEFGIGRGFVAHDYEVLGVSYRDAQARLTESLHVILEAWTGEAFTHHGAYFQFPEVEVWPRPEQRPHPPIWDACVLDGQRFDWQAGDTFCVPNWCWQEHAAGERDAVLFQASDLPVLQSLALYREQTLADNDGQQSVGGAFQPAM